MKIKTITIIIAKTTTAKRKTSTVSCINQKHKVLKKRLIQVNYPDENNNNNK
jgi:hypothetical protein